MKKLKKQLLEMQLKYNGLEKKCTNEARELQHNIEMTVKAINVIQCCKSDSEQLPNITLEQAIEKAKPNMDKIIDVDKHIEDIR